MALRVGAKKIDEILLSVRTVHALAPAQPETPHVEAIIGAAIQTLTTGRSHAECIAKANRPTQGFMTSMGRFVDRREALQLATAAGQLEGRTKHHPLDQLMSEDLWLDPAQPEELCEPGCREPSHRHHHRGLTGWDPSKDAPCPGCRPERPSTLTLCSVCRSMHGLEIIHPCE